MMRNPEKGQHTFPILSRETKKTKPGGSLDVVKRCGADPSTLLAA